MSLISPSRAWIRNNLRSTGLYRAIVITAVAFTFLFAAFILHWAGAGVSIIFLPWFIPAVSLFNILSLFAVAFLAAGRFNVLDDPSSFWIAMGSIGFGVALIFHTLTWPMLLPDGSAFIISFPDTPLWFLQFGITIFCFFLLAASLVYRPTNKDLGGMRLILTATVWTGALIIAFSLFIYTQPYLPELLGETAMFMFPLLVWNAMVAALFVSGAILSTRLYLKTGNSFPGYIAFAQMGIAFSLLITLMGIRQYDLWWYLARIIPTASILVALFGILSEYVQVFRREKQGREFINFALESSRIGAWQLNLNDQTANQTIEHNRIFGYNQPLQHWTYEVFLDHVLPENRDMVNSKIREAIVKNSNWSFECRIRRADNAVRWIFVAGTPQKDTMGNTRWTTGIVQDITERKQIEEALRESEERFRALVTSSSEIIYRMNPDWSEMLQIQNQGFLPGASRPNRNWFNDYIPPEDQPRLKACIDEAIRTKGVYEMEHRFRQADGDIGWVFSRAVPLFDEHLEIIEWFGAASNITERKRTEKLLQEVNATLERRVNERTQLAESRAKQLQTLAVELIEAEERERNRIAEFLHEDLQQIIVSVRMQLQALSSKEDSGPILEMVDRLLEESIEKSRRLAHELSPPVLYQFGLSASLKWLIRHMDKHFGMKAQLKEEMTHQISDKSLQVFLFRAAQELLFNSVKHSGVRNASICLYINENDLTLSVQDQGKGFEPDLLEFSEKGFGLGLISLRERSRALGGEMEIESGPGKGSKVALKIPLNLSESDESVIFVPEAEHLPGVSYDQKAASEPKTIRVLFTDDHKVMRQGLISMIADQPGIRVAGEAESGEEALELARQLKPDVIIMDISMPGMGGVEATRLIKAENPGIRVIGLSMFADESISEKMREAGADGFVSKSESSSELLKAIYEVAGEI